MSRKQVRFLLEPEAIQLVEAYGIPYPSHGLARCAEEAVRIADELCYPVVLKVVSPDIVHKSDVGGVEISLLDAGSVRAAYRRILNTVSDRVSGAEIHGVLVCEQARPGWEVIVGGLRDELFGPTVMFGLGGVFVEVLKDVAFRLAPLQRRDAEEMIREIQGYPLLTGVRRQEPCDVGALVDTLMSVSRLMAEHREIVELDLNPVRLYEDGLIVLDARAMKEGP
jgi:acyl-CoA synthetase (NDP forming)